MGYTFNKNGIIDLGTKLLDTGKFNVDYLLSLPAPNGKNVKLINVESSNTLIIDNLEQGLSDILEYVEHDSINNNDNILISINSDLLQKDPNILNKLERYVNKHNTSKINQNKSTNQYKNYVVHGILNVASSMENQLNFHAPMLMKEQQDLAKESLLSDSDKQLNPFNPFSIFLMEYQASIGKKVIGIEATALKVFFAIATVFNDKIDQFNDYIEYSGALRDNIISDWITLKTSMMSNGLIHVVQNLNFHKLLETLKNRSDLEDLYNEVNDLNNRSNQGWDVSLVMSGLLSSSTDNMKELILAKINATPDFAPVYNFLLTFGYSFTQIGEIVMSEDFAALNHIINKSIYDVDKRATINQLITHIKNNSIPGFSRDGNWTGLANYLWVVVNKKKDVVKSDDFDTIINLDTLLKWVEKNKLNFKPIIIEKVRSSEEVEEDISNEFEEEEDSNLDTEINYKTSHKFIYDNIKYLPFIFKINPELLDIISFGLQGSREQAMLGAMLSVNQGLKTNFEDSFTSINRVNNYVSGIITKVRNQKKKELTKNFGKLSDLEKEELKSYSDIYRFDFIKFLSDDTYQKESIDLYEKGKIGTNILEILTLHPNFSALAKTHILFDKTVKSLNKKSSMTYEILNSIKLSKNGSLDIEPRYFNIISNYINDQMILSWFNNVLSKEFSNFAVKKDDSYLALTSTGFEIQISEVDTNLEELTVKYDVIAKEAALMVWLNNMLKNLKSSFPNNAFTIDLNYYSKEDYDKSVYQLVFAPSINMMGIDKSAVLKDKYYKISDDFNNISTNTYNGSDFNKGNGGIEIGSLLFIYNLLVYKNNFATKGFNRLLENYFSTSDSALIDSYYNHIQNDFTLDTNLSKYSNKIAATAHPDMKADLRFKLFGKRINAPLDKVYQLSNFNYSYKSASSIAHEVTSLLAETYVKNLIITIPGLSEYIIFHDKADDRSIELNNSNSYIDMNGRIHINTYKGSHSAVKLFHEVMHIALILFRKQNPEGYNDFIRDNAEIINTIDVNYGPYVNMSQTDILDEKIVKLLTKELTNAFEKETETPLTDIIMKSMFESVNNPDVSLKGIKSFDAFLKVISPTIIKNSEGKESPIGGMSDIVDYQKARAMWNMLTKNNLIEENCN